MSAILVDSNVLLDVISEDSRWYSWSSATLSDAAERSRLVINPIIYAEISTRFSRIEDLEAALPRTFLEREEIPYEAAFLAYRKRGGTKNSPLADFFIGAHAAVAGYRLMTRDTERYRTYFPRLELIAPG